jgi:alpha-mannosidase
VRQLLYGKGWVLDRYGIDIRVGWNPDSFGYAWTLPMIFKGAGIDYFVTQKIGWNDTTEFPHRLFWWEAPDRSRVLGYFPFTYVDDAQPEKLAERLEHQEEQQPGLRDMLNLYGVGDHGGGPTREMIERYVAMSKLEAFPKVEHATPLEFMERVERQYTNQIPVWKDELYLEYHRGTFTTQGAVKRRNRGMESALESAEKLAAMADALVEDFRYPDRRLDGAWLRTLFNQFHDILPGSSIAEVFEDAHADYDEAEELVAAAMEKSFGALAGEIKTTGAKGKPVVVFNPLSWNRSEVVSVPVQDLGLEHEAFGVVDAEGATIPAQVAGDRLLFLAKDVPGIGYRTFWVRQAPKKGIETALCLESGEDRFVLDNDAVRAEIDTQSGDLRSVVLLPTGQEMLSPEGGNVLQLFGDIPDQWDAWNIGYTGEEWGVDLPARVELVESGPVRVTVRATRQIGDSELTQDYVLTTGSPLVEIRTHADWDESHKMLKTAFHVNADADTATFEIPYGTIDRTTKPQTDAEKAKWEVPGQRWVDVTDSSGEFGVTLVNDSKYGYDVKDSTLRLTLLRAPKYPDPAADIGEHEFAYALYPHEGGWRQADSYRRGAEYNVPMIPRVVGRQKGKLPSEQRLLWTESDHVVLSAFKAARVKRARPAFVLRVSEVEGMSDTVRLHFPMPIKAAWTATLMEDRQEELPVIDGNTIELPITRFALASVLVVPE